MPVLAKLRGVECARCREAGHRCQAQIIADGIALCMRCADDEPCAYVIAGGAGRMPEPADSCAVPRPTHEDRQAIRQMPRLPSIHATHGIESRFKITAAIRASILRADRELSAAELAQRLGIAKGTVENVRAEHRRKLREFARNQNCDRMLEKNI